VYIAKLCFSGLLCAAVGATLGCSSSPEARVMEGSGHEVLKALTGPVDVPKIHQLVYVPAYSEIYWGFDRQIADLAVTLSIRNVNAKVPIVVHSAKYFNSDGKEVQELVPVASQLGPLASADFVIQRRDSSGGTGANFLVEWSSSKDVDEPVIEAVMLGQHGNAGISFTGMGRVLPKASAELASPTR